MPMLAEVLLAYLICGICCLINCSLLITNASLFRWNSIIGFNQCCSINLDGVLMVLGLEEMEFEDTFFPLPLFLLPLWKPTHLRLGMSDLKEAIVGVEESEVCR
ncbi:uncharacterized protein [Euphorbia lathyris]|uniref:uncharacterized protein isoform X1 n=1 Tax=Euphorbia lathyris TaxID=212925 RepID=UPI003313B70B